MRFDVVLKTGYAGGWYARCNAAPGGPAEATADTEPEVLDKLRRELRFRLEMCPCSGVSEEFVELAVRRASVPRGSGWRS